MSAVASLATETTVARPEAEHAAPRRTASSARRFYRPELDLIRLIAFLAVFVHHGIYNAFPVLSRVGGFGLNLFFFLSAFLITELLQREKEATGTIAIGSFYIRRAVRIWPLYFGFVGFAVLLGYLFPGRHIPWGFVLSFMLMAGNLYSARVGWDAMQFNVASPLWSISVEEQFYLFWPLVNRLCSKRALRYVALSTFPVAMAAMVFLCAHRATPTLNVWTNTFVEFQFFAFGTLLSLALRGTTPQLSPALRAGLLLACLGLWLAASEWAGVNEVHPVAAFKLLLGYWFVGFGCIALFLSVYGMPARWIPAPLVYLGKISYGLYVFHKLALDFATWILNRVPVHALKTSHTLFASGHIVLGFAMTTGAAMLSYRYFETPFLKLKDKFAVIHTRAV